MFAQIATKHYRYLQTLLLVMLVAILFFIFPQQTQARSLTYPNYQVDININRDSTVRIKETITNTFSGEYRGVIRKITLEDRQKTQLCRSSGRTCGGLEQLVLNGVYDEQGRKLDSSKYEFSIEENEDTGKKYFVVKWEVWPGGKNHNGQEKFTWQIDYTVYGSLGWIGKTVETANPYLYWNALPEDRGGNTAKAEINIDFPEAVAVNTANLDVYTYTSNYFTNITGQQLRIQARDLGSKGNFTVAYRLPADSIVKPATVKYTATKPWNDISVKTQEADFGKVGGELAGLPAGEHELTFSRNGYKDKVELVELAPGEEVTIDASLEPTAGMQLLIHISHISNIFAAIFIPIGIWLVYRNWRVKGRDQAMPQTIVPKFQPPDGIKPYLLGALKDEKVDRQDIVGSIIDLAYRGHIRIVEVEKEKNYKLIRLDNSQAQGELDTQEQQLLEDIFGSQTERETKDLGKRFATRYPRLQKKIYTQMQELGYFENSPEKIRNKYIGLGMGGIGLGVAISVAAFIFGFAVMGYIGPVVLGFAVIAVSIALAIVGPFMPAKTAKGSKVYADILGFRMYLHTAERYRLQELGPEEFERYLSYAIVFGIEEEWAKKFEGIYEGQPEWFEAQDTDVIWSAYLVTSFSRAFVDNTTTNMVPSESGSGSGWSGSSGSFGGFSGGGGGGGASGGF